MIVAKALIRQFYCVLLWYNVSLYWAIFPNGPFSFFISVFEVPFSLTTQVLPNRGCIIIEKLRIFLFRFARLDQHWDILETGSIPSFIFSHIGLVLRSSTCDWLSWLMMRRKICFLLELAWEIIIAGSIGLFFRGLIGKKWLFEFGNCSVFAIGGGAKWAAIVEMFWGNDGSSH